MKDYELNGIRCKTERLISFARETGNYDLLVLLEDSIPDLLGMAYIMEELSDRLTDKIGELEDLITNKKDNL